MHIRTGIIQVLPKKSLSFKKRHGTPSQKCYVKSFSFSHQPLCPEGLSLGIFRLGQSLHSLVDYLILIRLRNRIIQYMITILHYTIYLHYYSDYQAQCQTFLFGGGGGHWISGISRTSLWNLKKRLTLHIFIHLFHNIFLIFGEDILWPRTWWLLDVIMINTIYLSIFCFNTIYIICTTIYN